MNGLEDFIQRLLPIVSNLWVLLTVSRLLDYGHGQKAFWFFVAGIFTSPLYHLCLGFPESCIWSLYKHKAMDFWTAELALPLIGLIFIDFRAPYLEKWIILAVVVVVGLLVTGTSSTFFSQAIIGGTTFVVVVVYVLWHRFAHGYWPKYDWIQLSLGILLGMFGVCFFIVQDWWPPYYGYLHSYWHTFVFIASYFLAGVRDPRPQTLNLDAAIVSNAICTVMVQPNRVVEGRILQPLKIMRPESTRGVLPVPGAIELPSKEQ